MIFQDYNSNSLDPLCPDSWAAAIVSLPQEVKSQM